MSGLHTSLVRDSHAYTRADEPWILDESGSVCGRLIKYIAGGGMRTFGRTLAQDATRRRQRRFLVISAILSLLWLFFYLY